MEAKDWIPLFQAGLWIGFYCALVALFHAPLKQVVEALSERIKAGSAIKVPGLLEMDSAPPSLPRSSQGVATSEKTVRNVAFDVTTQLESKAYPVGINDALCLVHEAQVIRAPSGKEAGLYRVRVHLESADLVGVPDDVVRVTYRLHDTFHRKVIATESRDKNFELWLNIYGEFLLVGYVEREGKEPQWVTRYLDLPGRPTN